MGDDAAGMLNFEFVHRYYIIIWDAPHGLVLRITYGIERKEMLHRVSGADMKVSIFQARGMKWLTVRFNPSIMDR